MTAGPNLSERIAALDDAIALASGRLDDATVEAVRVVVDKARARSGHGHDHTVVALAGSTGVGKSSLFNALVGADVSSPGVRRPTTSVAHAAVWGADASALLDWLGIKHRHHVAVGPDDPWFGLVLIDLPDFDSTEASNRIEADRLIELVDRMIWVTDPQKYADATLHDDHLRPLAGHAPVMSFVVNKIDTVPTEQRSALVEHARSLLVADGIDRPEMTVTAVTADLGLEPIRTSVEGVVRARRAMTERLAFDLRAAAATLAGEGGGTGGLGRADRRTFVQRLAHAAGVERAGEVVADQHRHDARAAMAWPPARLLSRWRRRHPIADVPRATASSVAGSEIDLALRDVAEAAAGDLAPSWRRALRDVASGHADGLRSRLTAVTVETAREAVGEPSWWSVIRWLQRALAVAVVVGAVWLIAAALLGGFFGFDTDPLLIDTPGAEWIPVPSLLVLGGLLAGLVVWLVVRLPVGVAARRRSRRSRRELGAHVDRIASETVLADLDDLLADRRSLDDALAVAVR